MIQDDRVREIYVLCVVQVQAASPLVAEAELPRGRELAFDGQICLLRVAVLEIPCDRKIERQNRERESRSKIILVGKERARGKWIEALLTGLIPEGQ